MQIRHPHRRHLQWYDLNNFGHQITNFQPLIDFDFIDFVFICFIFYHRQMQQRSSQQFIMTACNTMRMQCMQNAMEIKRTSMKLALKKFTIMQNMEQWKR